MVLDEGQHAVPAGVVGLEPVEAGSRRSPGCRCRAPGRAARSGCGARSRRPGRRRCRRPSCCRPPRARRCPAAASPASTTTSSALTPSPRAGGCTGCTRPAFGIPWRSSRGRRRWRRGVRAASDHRHQVGVVGAVDLVVVAQRTGVTAVALHGVLRAGGVVGRLGPGDRLLVHTRHHHDPVVVAGGVHRRLDAVEAAPAEQRLVDAEQRRSPGRRSGRGGRSAGRSSPTLRALVIELRSRSSELAWQTTRVVPGRESSSADANERAVGTVPPAQGETEQSGAGFGQYDGRSTCAWATAGTRTTSARTVSAAVAVRSRPAPQRAHVCAGTACLLACSSRSPPCVSLEASLLQGTTQCGPGYDDRTF